MLFQSEACTRSASRKATPPALACPRHGLPIHGSTEPYTTKGSAEFGRIQAAAVRSWSDVSIGSTAYRDQIVTNGAAAYAAHPFLPLMSERMDGRAYSPHTFR